MPFRYSAAFALTAASALQAQTVAPPVPALDLSTTAATPGTWFYAAVPGGSEATFSNSSAQPQVTIRCTRASRLVTISKPAPGAVPFLFVWSSAQTRNVPASFLPATGRLSISLGSGDSLLDAIAFSRGRVGFSVAGQPPLVLPSWAEAARVIEDCRV